MVRRQRVEASATLNLGTVPTFVIGELFLLTPGVSYGMPLTLEDAVAEELFTRSKSLAQDEVLRVASVLCNEAEVLGFDPFMLLAVIRIESNYNHLAISPVGAEGLMQLMPYTAVWFSQEVGLDWGDGHSFDPELNVRLGARYLHTLRHQFRGRMDRALTAYNRGPSATWAIIGRHGALPGEIRDFYATKVLDQYQKPLSFEILNL